MNILFISELFPWPLDNGACQRRFYLTQALARRHRVTLLTLRPEEPHGFGPCPLRGQCERLIEIQARSYLPKSARRLSLWAPFRQRLLELASSPLPAGVRYWNSAHGLVDQFRAVRESDRFDAVWVDRAFFGEVARRAGFRRFVVDVDDCQTHHLARQLRSSPWYRSKPLHYAELAKLFCYERTLPRRFWRLVVCKGEDRRFFGALAPRVFVVPNGVPDYPASPPERESPSELLFLGALDYTPNVDAALFFHQAILPRIRQRLPEARFRIVGRNPEPAVRALHNGEHCFVHADVPDVAPFYEQAAVVVAPIRQGSGTRLKVLEALGRGKALVATSMAAEGLDLRPGVDLEIRDEPGAFAEACLHLLEDAATRRRLGASGRPKVLERYHWDRIGEVAERVLLSADVPPAR